jgi:membrane protein DedA with SNARE-associated domain
MSEQFHVGTFVWGLILTLAGGLLAAIGFGWWEITNLDLRYMAPMFVILVGAVIVAGALTSRRDSGGHQDG